MQPLLDDLSFRHHSLSACGCLEPSWRDMLDNLCLLLLERCQSLLILLDEQAKSLTDEEISRQNSRIDSRP